jgi:hypothetical protein
VTGVSCSGTVGTPDASTRRQWIEPNYGFCSKWHEWRRPSVQQEAIDEATRKVDRSSPGYIRDFESHVYDRLASTAAGALGKVGVNAAAGLLVDTLSNLTAAEAAAIALGALGSAPPEAEVALRRVLESREHGPRARSAAARTLGALKLYGGIGVLARGLADARLAEACAEGLGRFGASGRPALRQLEALLARPSGAVRSGAGITYDSEASGWASARIAAAQAIASIDPRRAAVILAPYASDPDVGGFVRRFARSAGR